jgi:hypothetical protein
MKIIVEHRPTDQIPKDMKYTVSCIKCGRITMACDEPIPGFMIAVARSTPCSKCVKPSEFIKRFR